MIVSHRKLEMRNPTNKQKICPELCLSILWLQLGAVVQEYRILLVGVVEFVALL
jgi:hypothetical protein